MTNATETDLETLAAEVRVLKSQVANYKRGFLLGKLTYDDLAQAGKELSDAMYRYSKAKFPGVKAKRIPYQAIIR
ncbi:MAG: hypothetical protein KY445_08250 [Armatimonadetes bacterium]|nr:hypothetical protein [Armatimonadota bacterium]